MRMVPDPSLDQTEEREYRAQEEAIKRLGGLLWKVVGVACLLALYWVFDFFTGRGWGRFDWAAAIATLWLVPLAIRWNDMHDKAQEIRDKRAIRIEAKLDRWEQRQPR